ncbi:stage V sporulation protein AE [Salsuginibacillus halophilus]|uniref:Stage V sporulation protein AE n=1 Tax=Salsuginibacillus halophilus TaxID=517424 RepID=A0A2P8HAQ3_9BACI|nr:stage V sporulation protein AE [Salsuginibacillus halophilus]PSL43306.1 stage V sporulation protein AE [Salsuginibacillus halophilus]
MMTPVILITDGDLYARKAVETAANNLHASCLAKSSGNPTLRTAEDLLASLPYCEPHPVFLLFDDAGTSGPGPGETCLEIVVKSEKTEVLGALAVASTSHQNDWCRVDFSITRFQEITAYGVDKEGFAELELQRVRGDTLYNLDQLNIPVICGIGDPGKMGRWDAPERGAPVTTAALKEILHRSGYTS